MTERLKLLHNHLSPPPSPIASEMNNSTRSTPAPSFVAPILPGIPDGVVSLKDLEAKCLESLDPMVRDYLYDGAEEGLSIRENLEVWDRWVVVPRVMRDTSTVDLSPPQPIFGDKWRLPLGIAPSAMQQLVHVDGEKATVAAARALNVPLGLSTFSNYSIEDVKKAGGGSAVFLQTYMLKGRRDLNAELLGRAEVAGYKAVVLTVDTPIAGTRPALVKAKFIMPKHLKFRNFSEDFGGPLDQATDKRVTDLESASLDSRLTQKRAQLEIDPSINWSRDMAWLKENTNMAIWVKGILHPLDAEEAIKYGAAGIIVSNHGGRQLDGCISALDALPGIVKAVKGRVPVHVDGGVRRGADVFKALALGADFVWIGRPIWWGLHFAGEEGVRWIVETLEREFKVVMMLMGCRSLADIRREMIMPRSLLPSLGGPPLY